MYTPCSVIANRARVELWFCVMDSRLWKIEGSFRNTEIAEGSCKTCPLWTPFQVFGLYEAFRKGSRAIFDFELTQRTKICNYRVLRIIWKVFTFIVFNLRNSTTAAARIMTRTRGSYNIKCRTTVTSELKRPAKILCPWKLLFLAQNTYVRTKQTTRKTCLN